MVFAKCAECKNLINRGFFVECGKGLSPFSCVQEPINGKISTVKKDEHESTVDEIKRYRDEYAEQGNEEVTK